VAEIGVLLPLRADLDPGTVALLLLPPVLIAALAGLAPSVAAAVVGALVFNVLFTEPYGSLRIRQGESVAAFATYLLVGIVVAVAVDLQRRAEAEADQRARDSALLHDVTTDLIRSATLAVPVREALHRLVAELGLRGAAVRLGLGDRVTVVTAGDAAYCHQLVERYAPGPDWNGTVPGALDGQGGVFARSIATAEIECGVFVVDAGASPPTPRLRGLIDSLAVAFALAAGREQLHAEQLRRRALEETERFRRSLVNSMSDDLRTPLATIITSAGRLRGGAAERAAGIVIEREALRLSDIVSSLIELSRIESGSLRVCREAVAVDELLSRAVEIAGAGDAVEVDTAGPLGTLDADATLIQRALSKLIAQARQRGRGAPVQVLGHRVTGSIEIRVVDHGREIAVEDRRRIFQPYAPLPSGAQTGAAGLELAVAKGLVEAHGGSLRVEPTPGGGATMVVRLPTADDE
jgi:two-component system, OmpR family, sensor histidine kinase KdpD